LLFPMPFTDLIQFLSGDTRDLIQTTIIQAQIFTLPIFQSLC